MKEQVILLVSRHFSDDYSPEMGVAKMYVGYPFMYFANNSLRHCTLTEAVPFCRDPETGCDLYPAVTVNHGREIKLAIALKELYCKVSSPALNPFLLTEEERQKNMEAQEALCDRLGLPLFLLDNGRCPACGGDMLSVYPDSTYATHLITGCPMCGTSLCD